MISWILERTLGRWIDRRGQTCVPQPIATRDEHGLERDGTNIYLKRVIGGFVVTFNTYDRKTDRHEQRSYIITDEQDFQSELVKCITMEGLRR
jgi:hypothetical protein